jgi:hypothetical protein
MLTVPSAFRGTFGVLTLGHCAKSDVDSAAHKAKTTDMSALIRPPENQDGHPNIPPLGSFGSFGSFAFETSTAPERNGRLSENDWTDPNENDPNGSRSERF